MLPNWISSIMSVIVSFITFFLLMAIPTIKDLMTGTTLQDLAETGGFFKTVWSGVTLPVWISVSVLLGSIIGPLLISLFVWFTSVYLFFRITLMLLKAFLELVILIIFAPILLLFEAIPGVNAFSWWFKNMLGDIIPFPLVILFFMVANIMIETASSGSNFWSPPLLSFNTPEFSVLIGIGILFLIPEFVKLIKEAIGLKPMPIQIGLGTYFGGTAAAIGGATGLIGQFGSLMLGAQYIPGLKNLVNPQSRGKDAASDMANKVDAIMKKLNVTSSEGGVKG